MELAIDFIGATHSQSEFHVKIYMNPVQFYSFFIFEKDELRSAIFNLM